MLETSLEPGSAGDATRAGVVTRKLWKERGANSAPTSPALPATGISLFQPIAPNPIFFLNFLTWLGLDPACRREISMQKSC